LEGGQSAANRCSKGCISGATESETTFSITSDYGRLADFIEIDTFYGRREIVAIFSLG
jgi:hypothetical protein